MAGGTRRKRRMRLHTTADAGAAFHSAEAVRVPKRWVKLVVGIFLLPVAWILTQAFFTTFARATIHGEFWLTEEFWFFALGVVLWMVAFVGLPRPLWLYVFGHEITHAIMVWMMGGRVSRIHVDTRGGFIVANRLNTWIALAPYFLPIYSVLVICLFGWAGVFTDVWPYRTILYAAVGVTWAFHLSFTCVMIPKGQSDLAYGGAFFSLVVIYLMNLLILSALLILAAPQVSLRGFARQVFLRSMEFIETIHILLRQVGA